MRLQGAVCLLGLAVQFVTSVSGAAAAAEGAGRRLNAGVHSGNDVRCKQCSLAFATGTSTLTASSQGKSSGVANGSGVGVDCRMQCGSSRVGGGSGRLLQKAAGVGSGGSYMLGDSLCNDVCSPMVSAGYYDDGDAAAYGREWKAEYGCYGYGCYTGSAVAGASMLVAPPLSYGATRESLCAMSMTMDRVTNAPSSSVGGATSSLSSSAAAAAAAEAAAASSVSAAPQAAVAIEQPKPEKKVLILMSDTGGGHRASAIALQDAFNEIFPGQIQTKIVDIWTEYSTWPFNRAVEVYKYLAKHPHLWKLSYDYGRFPLSRLITNIWSNLKCHKLFRKCIEDSSPDLIISVHPLCQDLPMKVLRTMGKEMAKLNGNNNSEHGLPAFVTVVTDLGSAHPTWFNQKVDACYVPSVALQKQALRRGLSKDKVYLEGLPLRSRFWDKGNTSKADMQRQLGLTVGAPTALVVGGGDGVGRIAEIAHHMAVTLAADVPGSQLVVICGNNKEVKEKLEAHAWPQGVSVVIKGFASNMDEWMEAADLLVTKAGPGTIAEAATKGLPLILSSFLPGQEKGNVPYVVKGGFGVYKRRPTAIARVASEWLRDPAKLESMKQAALQHGNPTATKDIAYSIANTLLFA